MATQLLLLTFHIVLISAINAEYSALRVNDGPIRGVSLGGWLVVEKWIKPSLFDRIQDNELLDGSKLQFLTSITNSWISVIGEGLVANASSPGVQETFTLWREPVGLFKLKTNDGKFLSVENNRLKALEYDPEKATLFSILRNGKTRSVHISFGSSSYLMVEANGSIIGSTIDNLGWESGPFLFEMIAVKTMEGEFALVNGLGPDLALEVMNTHWSTFITEPDFEFISNSNLNCVRIPIGWWMAFDPNPPWPYVPGSKSFLDKAFDWAEKYNLKILIDLHSVPGSCNGWDLGGSRDGSTLWPLKENVDTTLKVIDIISKRYGGRSSLFGIQLLNEPRWYIDQTVLKKYYVDAYKIVQANAPNAKVQISTLIDGNPFSLVDMVQNQSYWPNLIIDTSHWYSLYWGKGQVPQWYVNCTDLVFKPFLSELQFQYKVPVFVGEFSLDLSGAHPPPTFQDFKDFSEAEIRSWSMANGGWFFFTFKRDVGPFEYDPWSFKDCMTAGILDPSLWTDNVLDLTHDSY